jgi:hypothetical protein
MPNPREAPAPAHPVRRRRAPARRAAVLAALAGLVAPPASAGAAADAATLARDRVPRHWRGDYRRVGHWVAQFAMFAPLFGPDGR